MQRFLNVLSIAAFAMIALLIFLRQIIDAYRAGAEKFRHIDFCRPFCEIILLFDEIDRVLHIRCFETFSSVSET